MENEIRETVYLSISLIILGIVLSFIAVMCNIQNNIADVVYKQQSGETNVQEYVKYNAYNDTEVTGYDVIECMSMNTDIDIYVDNVKTTFSASKLESAQSEIGSNNYMAYLLCNNELPTESANEFQTYGVVTGISFVKVN